MNFFKLQIYWFVACVWLVIEAHGQLPAGSCHKFTGVAPLSQCQSVIPQGTLIWVPANVTFNDLDAQVANVTQAFRLGLTSKKCSDAAMRLFCAQGFPQCFRQVLSPTIIIELPELPCLTRCETFYEECGEFLRDNNLPGPNCTADVIPGIPQYPLQFYSVPLRPGFLLNVPCFSPAVIAPYPEVPRATCQKLNPTPLSYCDHIVDYDVYVPEGLTQSQMDQIAYQNNGLFRIGLVPKKCMDDGMRLACLQVFRKCIHVPVSPLLPDVLYPGATCEQRCVNMVNRCKDSFKGGLAALLPNCSSINPLTGFPDYPNGEQIIDIGGNFWRTACNNENKKKNWPYVPLATCEPFVGTKYSPCEDVIDRRVRNQFIYVPEGETYKSIDKQAGENVMPLLYKIVPKKCSDSAMRYVCTFAFRPCVVVPIPQQLLPPGSGNLSTVLPAYPCYDVCTDFVSKCSETIETAGEDPPDCDSDNEISQTPEYPLIGTSVNLGFTIVNQPCVDDPKTADASQDCPDPFRENDDDDDDEDACIFPCPVPIYSDAEYTIMKVFCSVFAFLSFISSIFLIVTFSLDKKKRQFPANMPLWIAFAAMGFSIGFFIGIVFGFDYVICDNDGLCKLQAVVLLYFQYALACWMMVLALNIFITVAVKFKRVALLQIPYHIFCWGAGIAPFIVGLAIDRMVYFPPTIVCFVGADPNGWPLIGLYTIPIGIIVIFTVIFTLLIVWRIYKVSRELDASFIRSLLEQWRIFLFIAVFLYIFLYNIEESIRASVNYDTNVEGFTNWGTCVYKQGNDDGCEFDPTQLYYPLSLLFIINTSLQGFLVNIIFLTSPSTFSFWYNRVKSLASGQGFYGAEYDLEGTVVKKHGRSKRSQHSRTAQMSSASVSLPGDEGDDFSDEDL